MVIRPEITIWLGSCCVIVLVMVLLGGITRLTNSGLSITEWRPIVGIIPPIGDDAWQQEREKYEQTPEYRYLTNGITLKDFKYIYLIEYIHRLCGRVLAITFFIPMLYFVIKRKIHSSFMWKLILIAVLGIAQGGMGWFMVQSGLVHVPHVSHYRLAAHLFFTVILFSLLLNSFLNSGGFAAKYRMTAGKFSLVATMLVLTVLQMLLGALVAGLDAGLMFNTFPTMNGELIPDSLFSLDLLPVKFLSDGIAVQFLHRLCAVVATVCAAVTCFVIRRLSTLLLGTLVILQFLLGVATLLFGVPILLALMHQIMAFVIIGTEVYLLSSSQLVKLEK